MTKLQKEIFNNKYNEITTEIDNLKGLIKTLEKQRDEAIDEQCIFVSRNIQEQINDYQKQLDKLIYCRSVLKNLYNQIAMEL